jgi:hypothetical protein
MPFVATLFSGRDLLNRCQVPVHRMNALSTQRVATTALRSIARQTLVSSPEPFFIALLGTGPRRALFIVRTSSGAALHLVLSSLTKEVT